MESYFLDSVLVYCESKEGGTVPLKGRRVITGYYTTKTNAYGHNYGQPYHDLTFLRLL